MNFVQNWEKIQFADPLWLILLCILPVIAWFQNKTKVHNHTLLFSKLENLKINSSARSGHSQFILKLLRYFSLFCIIIAASRPQYDKSSTSVSSSGVDIVLAIDLSSSMLALDMSDDPQEEITRLDVVKDVIKDFVNKRTHDRIGLVAFTTESRIASALTLDKEFLQQNIARLRVGLISKTGTNIGAGLAEGINLLRALESKSKILISLTDGKDDPPPPNSPLIYAEGAKKDGIKIYTIAFGSDTIDRTYIYDPTTRDIKRNANEDPIVYELPNPLQNAVDKEILKKISNLTEGRFYEGKNKSELLSIYDQIDKLEKTEVELSINAHFEELFLWPVALGLILLVFEFLLAKTFFLRIP